MADETPVGLRAQQHFEFVITAEARTLEKFKKVATVTGRTDSYTIESDEGGPVGGDASAPTPLMYLTAALAF